MRIDARPARAKSTNDRLRASRSDGTTRAAKTSSGDDPACRKPRSRCAATCPREDTLARWEAGLVRGQLRAAGRPRFVLHDGPPYANGDPPRPRGPTRSSGHHRRSRRRWPASTRLWYIPGWDCHGLPIEIAIEKFSKGRGTGCDPVPQGNAREYANRTGSTCSAANSSAWALGDWNNPIPPLDPAEADEIRAWQVVENDWLVPGLPMKPVYWSIGVLRWPGRCRIPRPCLAGPVDRLTVPGTSGRGAFRRRRAGRMLVPIWTTTPWTLPASLAISMVRELDYVLVEGPLPGADGSRRWLVLPRRWRRLALKRYGVPMSSCWRPLPARELERRRLPPSVLRRTRHQFESCSATTSAPKPAPAPCIPRPATARRTGLAAVRLVEIFGGRS